MSELVEGDFPETTKSFWKHDEEEQEEWKCYESENDEVFDPDLHVILQKRNPIP